MDYFQQSEKQRFCPIFINRDLLVITKPVRAGTLLRSYSYGLSWAVVITYSQVTILILFSIKREHLSIYQ